MNPIHHILTNQNDMVDADPLLDDAVRLVVQFDKVSASLLQRKMKIGYARAARLIEAMEVYGIIERGEGVTPRNVLISSYEEYQAKSHEAEPPATEEEPNDQTYSLPQPNNFRANGEFSTILSNLPHDTAPSFPLVLGTKNSSLFLTTFEKNPHALITGNPKSNKIPCLETMLCTLLATHTPHDLKLIIFDGTHTFRQYDALPHLLTPVITKPDKFQSALRWTEKEIDERFKQYSESGCQTFNEYVVHTNTPMEHIVVVITMLDWFLSQSPRESAISLQHMVSIGAKAGVHILATTDSASPKALPPDLLEAFPLYMQLIANQKQSALTPLAESLAEDELLFTMIFQKSWEPCTVARISQEDKEKLLAFWKKS